MRVALRTSATPPATPPITRPPLTNTLFTSGRAPIWRTTAPVTALVSSSREPGGSSMASSARPVSSAGRKPDGSRKKLPTEAAKIASPSITAAYWCRTDQRTSRV